MGLIVVNRGRCGQNSGIMRERFADDVLLARPAPQHVLIAIGMNDAINDRFFTPLDAYLEHVAWMMTSAHDAGIRPTVCTIHRVTEEAVYRHHPRHHFGGEGVNGKIDRYNAALRPLVADRRGGLADFARAADAVPPSEMLTDGVHLTPAGNRLLARTFLDAIGLTLRGSDVVVCVGDSLTYGYGNEGCGTATGDTYPAFLQAMASARRADGRVGG